MSHAALDCRNRLLAIRQRLAAANHDDLSLQFYLHSTMKNVEAMHFQLGDLDRALDVQQQRLKIAESGRKP